MKPSAANMIDQLWFRTDLAWPTNDKPDELRTARLFNLLYTPYFPHPETFWDDYFAHKKQNRVLLYTEFEDKEPQCSFVNLLEFYNKIEEGLLLWKSNPTVRFTEELTNFFDVGHPQSRRFTPKSAPLPNLPIVTFSPEVEPIRKAYNESRIATFPQT